MHNRKDECTFLWKVNGNSIDLLLAPNSAIMTKIIAKSLIKLQKI